MSRWCLLSLAALLACARAYEDAARKPARIVDDEKATVVTGELGNPLYVPCLESKNPTLFVFWYRGHGKGKLLKNDAVYGMRRNALLIRSLAIDTLGPYTCQAFNSENMKPLRMFVVRANMSDETSTPDIDWLAPSSAGAPSPGTQPSTSVETSTITMNITKASGLWFTEPVRTPAGSAGGENAWVIGELDRPLQVCCPAYGYLPPAVEWYRSNKGNTLLYNDTEYEPRGNVLLIRNLEMNNLGKYSCGSNNGVGQPASWKVVVKAYKPEGLFTEYEFLVPRGTVAPSVGTQCLTTTETTTTTTLRTTEAPTDPVRMPAIAGGENAWVIGELDHPFRVCCPAYGYPPPAVEWYRSNKGNTLLYNDTEYEPRGNVLLIRNLEMNNLGTYTCGANNGVGQPASWKVVVKAYKPEGLFSNYEFLVPRGTVAPSVGTQCLTTSETTTTTTLRTTEAPTDPVRMPAIAGGENAWVIGELDHPFRVCCPAYGYPPPAVEWYRSNKGNTLLYNDTEYEPRGNVLLIRNLTMGNLGTYTCGANNGVGQPASWKVVVKAYKPEGLYNEYEFLVPRGTVAPSVGTQCLTTSETTTTTTLRTTEAPTVAGCEGEGCTGPCSTSPYGCCQDDKTPAHGPDFEGCCLLQVFGCCPGNRRPAEGPHLEGCGCQYALHGCCPDNVTIAQGPDNQGCGCQYTEYGCCPDRHTAASGPNNEGCACNTYQFGCCADGVTTATGPEQQGCHCRDSKFGCCGEGETPATGPDGAGCDCSSSRHGCCPDGRTEATGPKFLGCTDAPKNKQAACSMSTDPGPCHNFTAMWYYDLAYGGCSRFFYGGCDGNDNRFSNKEECEDVCEQPSPKDACKLPSVKGACDADHRRWHYNTTLEQCIPFRYGGCLGNANNFDTRELCQKQCEPSSVEGQCNLPIDQGSCAGNYSRWGFNSEAHRCEQFIWGGCEGNSNRFSSEAACQMRCVDTQPRGVASLVWRTVSSTPRTWSPMGRRRHQFH